MHLSTGYVTRREMLGPRASDRLRVVSPAIAFSKYLNQLTLTLAIMRIELAPILAKNDSVSVYFSPCWEWCSDGDYG